MLLPIYLDTFAYLKDVVHEIISKPCEIIFVKLCRAHRKECLSRAALQSVGTGKFRSIIIFFSGLWIRIDFMRIRLRIRIQHFFYCGSGSSSRSRVLMIKNLKTIYCWKYFFIYLVKNCNLYLCFRKGHPSYRRSLQPPIREHPALQNMKILYFFLFLWVIFALLDPDPLTSFDQDPTFI